MGTFNQSSIVSALPEATQRLLLAAAAAAPEDMPLFLGSLSEHALADWVPAEEAGLVRLDATGPQPLLWRDPSTPRALYEAAPFLERQAAHRVLADALARRADRIRAGVLSDRSQFYQDLAVPFYGGNREGATLSQGLRDQFWRLSMQAGLAPAYDCVEQFSAVDYTADLEKIDVPVLVAHGDDDQIVPIAAAAYKTAKIVKDATLKVYPGAPHGISGAYEEQFTKDLLEFIAS